MSALKNGLLLVVLLVHVSGASYAQPGSGAGLKFIENKNQWPAPANFAARIPGGNMMISPGKFNYYFVDAKKL